MSIALPLQKAAMWADAGIVPEQFPSDPSPVPPGLVLDKAGGGSVTGQHPKEQLQALPWAKQKDSYGPTSPGLVTSSKPQRCHEVPGHHGAEQHLRVAHQVKPLPEQ